MITVTFNDKSFECTKAIKGSDYIHLLDANDTMIASFEGITSFTGFSISGGSWTTPTSVDNCRLAVIGEDGVIRKSSKTCSIIGNVWEEIARFTTVGNHTFTADFTGKIGVLVVGGGGSGSICNLGSSNSRSVCGGASGYAASSVCSVTTGDTFDVVVGAGGAAKSHSGSSNLSESGNAGGNSSFGELVAHGGQAGLYGDNFTYLGASKGTDSADASYGLSNLLGSQSNSGAPWQCINPFTGESILGGGGGVHRTTSAESILGEGGKNPLTGLGGGDGCVYPNTSGINPDATEFGCGGGGAWGTYSSTIISGKGGDGIVIVYRRG